MLIERIMGVFRLNSNTFEEIEADRDATTQAVLVVLIVALIAAFGRVLLIGSADDSSFLIGFISVLIGTFVGWVVWSAITYFVGTSLFGGQADMGEMLRVIGFAYAPQILRVIPYIGDITGFIWSLIAGFIAVRQGLDLDNTKAFLTIVVGFIVYVVLVFLVDQLLGGGTRALGTPTGG